MTGRSDIGSAGALRWSRHAVAFWAVSDLDAQEPADLARLLQRAF